MGERTRALRRAWLKTCVPVWLRMTCVRRCPRFHPSPAMSPAGTIQTVTTATSVTAITAAAAAAALAVAAAAPAIPPTAPPPNPPNSPPPPSKPRARATHVRVDGEEDSGADGKRATADGAHVAHVAVLDLAVGHVHLKGVGGVGDGARVEDLGDRGGKVSQGGTTGTTAMAAAMAAAAPGQRARAPGRPARRRSRCGRG